jgi:CheY-like chemotaxis protein
MSHKILIADDSLTIQKVIKITLANEPFELAVCASDKDLADSIKNEKPHIVLLDFNLSEDKTGYELSKDILKLNSDIAILMLYGTFDTIDEDLLSESGVSSKIVKPFDGTKFINLCRSLAQSAGGSDDSNQVADFSMDSAPVEEEPEVIEEEPAEETAPLVDSEDSEDWVMNSPQQEEPEIEPELPKMEAATEQSVLEKDLADWGMNVPGVIGDEKKDVLEIPDVIESASVAEEAVADTLPSDDDLEYPEINAATEPEVIEEESDKLPSNDDLEYPDMSPASTEIEAPESEPSSKLISLDELKPADPGVIEMDDDATGEFIIENGDLNSGTTTEEEVKALESQIADELDEEDDLWAADEVEEVSEIKEVPVIEEEPEIIEEVPEDDIPTVEPHKLREVMENTPELSHLVNKEEITESTPSDFPADVMDDEPARPSSMTPAAASFEVTEELKEKLKEQLTPVVEEFVKSYCQENIEKIAWEVIPDLAENLIKKEIQKISDNILNS